MIGWRIGWVVGPAEILHDVNLVGLSNVVCPVGIAQEAVAAALTAPTADADMARATSIWKRRRDLILQELDGFAVIPPDGGWSMLIDVTALGLSADAAVDRLFTRGRIAATPMTGWGPAGERYVRFVFANEPIERLGDLRTRVDVAWVR